MNKTLLLIALCAVTLASGALLAQPGISAGINAQAGQSNAATPATPATPAVPANPTTTPATPAVPATPATPPASGEGDVSAEFGRLDVNADGGLSRDEAKADLSLNKRFRSLDKNKDGSLSADEYNKMSAGTRSRPNG
jgi:hypothetical protein